MLDRFVRIRTKLLAVADTDGATVTVETIRSFKERVEKFLSMLSEIANVTKALQKSSSTKLFSIHD